MLKKYIETINILLKINMGFENYYLVTLSSLFENNEVNIHVFCLYVKEDKNIISLFSNIVKKYGNVITFIKIDDPVIKNLSVEEAIIKNCYHIFESYQILPQDMERILYLNNDVIINDNILDYYKTEFDNKYMVVRGQTYKKTKGEYHKIGARPEKGQYFDSRILLLNLSKFRQDFSLKNNLEILREYGAGEIQSSQGLLNVIFQETVKYESRLKYNFRFSIIEEYVRDGKVLNNEIPAIISYEKRDYYNFEIPVVPWEIRFDKREISALKEIGIVKQKYDLQLMENVNHYMITLWWNYAEKTELYNEFNFWMLHKKQEILKNTVRTDDQIRNYKKKREILETFGDSGEQINCKWLDYIQYHDLEEYIDSIDRNLAIRKMKSLFQKNCEEMSFKEKIKVGFIAYSSAEWQCDKLYLKLKENDKFIPIVLIARYPYGNENIIKEKYIEACGYFEKKGYDIYYADDINTSGKESNKIEEFDILIYFTPFDLLTKKWNILERPIRQLCIHIPYAYYLVSKDDSVYLGTYYDKPIFKMAWFYFASCKLQAEIATKRQRLKGYNIKASGFPKMDILVEHKYNIRENLWKTSEKTKIKVIWAPHFNMRRGMNGTFHYNYLWLLEFAKRNEEISWIVRPHPRMEKGVLEQKIFQTSSEYKEYIKQWNELPNARVIPYGDYYDIFASSDAMILDSVSFLAEYQFTGKPLLLLQPECRRALSELGEKLVSVLYTASGKDFEAIKEFLQKIMNGIDPQKKERISFWNEYLNYTTINKKTATEYIYDTIIENILGM